MPLIRFHARNEFGMGDPKLYREADEDDPKAILDGVAVSGLIGLLRQLGDLAEFAAEVFNDLQEQVTTTTSRCHKMVIRVQHIEASLPSLEKAVMAQRSHIHFAYIGGFIWHPNIQIEQNHLIHNKLPQFIMDPYEECRGPPHLFLLDKFDSAGAGACSKRYSDPSFFRMVWGNSELMKVEKVQQEEKAPKSKMNGPQQRNGIFRRAVSLSGYNSRMRLGSPDIDGQSLVTDTNSMPDVQPLSNFSNRSNSLDSKSRSHYIENVPDIDSSMGTAEKLKKLSPFSDIVVQESETLTCIVLDEQNGEGADNGSPHGSFQGQDSCRTSSVSWDEKTEVVTPRSELCRTTSDDQCPDLQSLPAILDEFLLEQDAGSLANSGQQDTLSDVEKVRAPFLSKYLFDDVTSGMGNRINARNTVESEVEKNSSEVKPTSESCKTIPEDQCHNLEPVPMIVDQSKLKQDTGSLAKEDQEDILFDVEEIAVSFSSRILFNEVRSGTDNHVDALNTAESEVETDVRPLEVKSTNELCKIIPEHQYQNVEPLPPIFDQSKLEQDTGSLVKADPEDILFDVEEILVPFSTKSQFHVVTSGTDDHIDALNSTKSQVERDLEPLEVKPTSELCRTIPEHLFQDPEPLPVIFDQSKMEQDSCTLSNEAQKDIMFNVEEVPVSYFCKNQFNEVTSGTDNHMDAFNTAESKVETDLKLSELKPTSELFKTIPKHLYEDPGSLQVIFDQSKSGQDTCTLANKDHDGTMFDVEEVPVSCFSKNQITEVTSGTDSYMEALKTTESKIEVDLKLSEVKPTRELCRDNPGHQYQEPGLLPVIFDLPKLEQNNCSPANDYEENILFNVEVPVSCFSENQSNKVSNGTDNHMDALNTAEYEVELDLKLLEVKPSSGQCETLPEHQYQDPEPLPVIHDEPKLELDICTFANEDREDILFDMENRLASISGENKFNEMTSGINNFVDALNTMEGEESKLSELKSTSELLKTIPDEQCQDLDGLPVFLKQSKLKQEIGNVAEADQEEILFCVKDLLAPFSSKSQFSEMTNGTDNVMDAPKMIESEVKTDSELSEVKPSSEPCKIISEDQQQCLDSLPVSLDQDPNSVPFSPNQSKLEGAGSLADAAQDGTSFYVENTPFFVKHQFDEVRNGTDIYMDTPSATDSEVEMDLDCQTKWEVELQPSFKDLGLEPGKYEKYEIVAQSSVSSDEESPTSSSNKEMSPDVFGSISSGSLGHAQPLQVTTLASHPNYSADSVINGSPGIVDICKGNGFESFSNSASSVSSICDKHSTVIAAHFGETRESPVTPGVSSVRFWTNGGLLGLEPSKPPDFSVVNVVRQNSNPVTKNATDDLPIPAALPKFQHDELVGIAVETVEAIKENLCSSQGRDGLPGSVKPTNLANICPTPFVGRAHDLVQPIYENDFKSWDGKQDDAMPVKNSQDFITAALERISDNSKELKSNSVYSRTNEQCLTEASLATPEDKLHSITHNDILSNDSVQNSAELMSTMSAISHRFLAHGLWKKASPPCGSSSELSSIVKSDTMKLQDRSCQDEPWEEPNRALSNACHNLATKERLKLESLEYPFSSNPRIMDCPSPPLEHMKIAFHPINGLETSLKLDFPDRHHHHGSIDIFPLFRLRPEAAFQLQDIGSESDDGTFYKSSSLLSDDIFSPRSSSNSEQWEPGETAGSQDHEIYSALQRVSSVASISSSYENEGITHLSINPACEFGSSNAQDSNKSFDSSQLSVLDSAALNSLPSQHEGENRIETKGLPALQYPSEQSALLPPLEWRITKPTFTLLEGSHVISEDGNLENDLHIQDSLFQQPRPSALHHIEEATTADGSMDRPNGSSDLNEAGKSKRPNERGDFVPQIRIKVFEGPNKDGNVGNRSSD